jgi:hypothetical protein
MTARSVNSLQATGGSRHGVQASASRSADENLMRLLVPISKGHRVGEQPVYLLGHFQAYGFLEFERQQVAHRSIGVDFAGTLVKSRLRTDPAGGLRIAMFFSD